jgi:hypothetical protein
LPLTVERLIVFVPAVGESDAPPPDPLTALLRRLSNPSS